MSAQSKFLRFIVVSIGWGLFFWQGLTASAHEVKEMTARARVFSDRVEMLITVSTHMATLLLAEPKAPSVELNLETFPALRARLVAQGTAFCTLRSWPEEVLAASSVDVVMSSPEELTFFVTYPPPTHPALRFEMKVLDRLEAGYIVTLEVLDATRKSLASKPLLQGETALEIRLDKPVSADPPGKP